jgi:hypothetical protein
MKKLLTKIPELLASEVSIFIFMFLFVYLVIFGIIGLFNAFFAKNIAPNSQIQLVLGNYTNVVSALGAAIAAGASTATHSSLKKLHSRHDKIEKSLAELHEKVDNINK